MVRLAQVALTLRRREGRGARRQRRRPLAVAALTATFIAGAGLVPAAAEVTEVSGGAFGYQTFIGLFGGPPSLRGPEGTTNCDSTSTTACTPTVVLPAAGSATPITATDPDGAVAQYGPAVIHRSASESVSTEGTTGGSGTVRSSAVITFPAQSVQNGPFFADAATSECTATEAGQSGATTLTNASLALATYPQGHAQEGEPRIVVELPENPPPNLEYEGTLDHVGDRFRIVFNEQLRTPDAVTVSAFHMYLLGEIAVGEYILGRSRCGVSGTAPNQAPVAGDDAFDTVEDTPLTVAPPAVLANDTDPDGDPLTARKPPAEPVPTDPPINCSGQGPCAEPIFFPTEPGNGSVVVNIDGSFTYTPNPGFVGTETFTYVADDPRGWSDTGVVTITVNPNQPPVAGDDSYSTPMGVPLNVPAPGVLANDTDPEGSPLTAGSASDPRNGSVTLNTDGSFTYTPDAFFVGNDEFTYVVTDDKNHTDTGTVTITVTLPLPNLPPDAVDDSYPAEEDTVLTVAAPGVLGNDTDPDGDRLAAAVAAGPGNGSVTLNTDGSFAYTPGADFNGSDSFTYTASDGRGGSDMATVTITVAAVNDAPVAVDDAYATGHGTPLSVSPPGVLGNDTDPDGDPLAAGSATDPAGGTVVLNADGSFTYTPDAGFSGTDTFTYTATDPEGGTDTATVTIAVAAPALKAPADFDGDGTTDISIFRPSTGGWYVAGQQTVFHGRDGDVAVPGDFDGDGDTDVAVFRPANGGWYVQGQTTVFHGRDGDLAVPADYDGDGDTDIAVFRPATGGWYIAGQQTLFHGRNGDIPLPGHYDTDPEMDLAVFRPATGGWYVAGQQTVFHGRNGDVPVPGDYDGDGDTDIAVFRPATGGWYIAGQQTLFHGRDADVPVPGDYDGDGDTDIAVFRPSTGGWYVHGQTSTVFHGRQGDVPLPLYPAVHQAVYPTAAQ